MKLILMESVDNLGGVGDIVNVKPGYARNYLLPRNKAMAASARNMKHIKHQQMMMEHKLVKAKIVAEEVHKTLEGKNVEIVRKAGENGKLFGSVTTMDIAEALRQKGITVNRKFIRVEDAIKNVGSYKVPIKLDGGLEASVNIEVVAETE